MMKRFSFLMTICFLMLGLSSFSQKGYSIKFNVKGVSDSTAYLSYYYGKGQYYKDTAQISKKGEFTFSDSEDTLEHGMYSVIVNESKLFDLLVDNQNFSVSTDTANLILNMKIKNSPENTLFYEYMTFLNLKQKEARALNKLKKEGDADADKKLKALDNVVKKYIADFHKKNKGSFTSNFIYAIERPEVPEPPKNPDGSIDSTFAFRYFKAHFFDNYDFSDERLLRTSTFHEKIFYYLEKLTLQDPDSIIKSVDYILSLADENKTLFKYALSTLTSHYERSENMGMDAVFVHLSKNYFMKGKAGDWFTDKQLEKLVERTNALEPLLIGKKAPNIVVKDTAQKKFLQLYDIDADFTIVYIWSPECGHCKVSTPKLKKLYDKVKDQGVEVFGIGNEFENELWIEFINKHDLNWINGSDGPTFKSNFRSDYDVYSTPQTYLLDKDKKILSKKMSVESLEKILQYFMDKRDREKNEK